MTVEPRVLLAIAVMAAITYATRVAGLAFGRRLSLGPRGQAVFDAIPPAVLVAVIAPSAIATGWAETGAALVAAFAAARLPLLGVIAVGVAAVVALRQAGL